MSPWRSIVFSAVCAFCLCARAEESFDRRAADCATANQIWVSEQLAQSIPLDEPAKAPLLRQIELGLSFAGTAYKQGLRDPFATELLKQSAQRITPMAASEREVFQQACNREAQSLWEAANGMERWLVQNKARSALQKMIEGAKPVALSGSSKMAS